MSPDESTDLATAVTRARERLEELSPLMQMAISLDERADIVDVTAQEQPRRA